MSTDRVFAPGEIRRHFICKEWQIFADDITISTGKCIDGMLYTGEEYGQRVEWAKANRAGKESSSGDQVGHIVGLHDALRVLGFGPDRIATPAAKRAL